jgi:putative sugar O-methyltransferase
VIDAVELEPIADRQNAPSGLPSLRAMLDEMEIAPEIVRPSAFWESMNEVNLKELEAAGLTTFKRTINRHDFRILPSDPRNKQFRAMARYVMRRRATRVLSARLSDPSSFPGARWGGAPVSRIKAVGYARYVAALWEYTRKRDNLGLLDRLEEPALGHPVSVDYVGRRISEDLCNSVLELTSITDALPERRVPPGGIVELGSGYGGLAWVFLEAFPEARYLLVDIPPALAIAEEYLSALFPGRRIFRFRQFDRYEEVREELEHADVGFLTPNQLDLVPPLGAGVLINVGSLHEMRPDQVSHYISEVATHCSGYFYTKQWLRSINRRDGVVIRREDYPIPSGWTPIFDRRHPVQTRFFEALFRLPSPSAFPGA